MTLTAFQSEWLKTYKRPLTLWAAGILLTVVLLSPILTLTLGDYFVVDTSQGLAIWAGSLPPEALLIAQQKRIQAMWPYIPFTALGTATGLGRVLMIIVGAALAGSEFTWETGRHLIGRTRDRRAFVLNKVFIIAVLAVLLLAGGLLTGTFSGGSLTPIAHEGPISTFPFSAAWRLPLALLVAALTVLPYALFAFTITLVTRSNVAGVAIGLLTLIIGEPFLAQLISSLAEPWSNLVNYMPITATQIVVGWIRSIIGGVAPAYLGRSIVVLMGYTLALSATALASFRRRELP